MSTGALSVLAKPLNSLPDGVHIENLYKCSHEWIQILDFGKRRLTGMVSCLQDYSEKKTTSFYSITLRFCKALRDGT